MVGITIAVSVRPKSYIIRKRITKVGPAVTIAVWTAQSVEGRITPVIGAGIGRIRRRWIVTVTIAVTIEPLARIHIEGITLIRPAIAIQIRATEPILYARAVSLGAVISLLRRRGIVSVAVAIRVEPLSVIYRECVGPVRGCPAIIGIGITIFVSIGTADAIDCRVAFIRRTEITILTLNIVAVPVTIGIAPLSRLGWIIIASIRPAVTVCIDATESICTRESVDFRAVVGDACA